MILTGILALLVVNRRDASGRGNARAGRPGDRATSDDRYSDSVANEHTV